MEILLKLNEPSDGQHIAHVVVVVYLGNKKRILIDGNYAQFDAAWQNRIYCGEYTSALRELGLVTVEEGFEYLIRQACSENPCGLCDTEAELRRRVASSRLSCGFISDSGNMAACAPKCAAQCVVAETAEVNRICRIQDVIGPADEPPSSSPAAFDAEAVRLGCRELESILFNIVGAKWPSMTRRCIHYSYILSQVLSQRYHLATDGESPNRCEMEMLLKLDDSSESHGTIHAVVVIYVNNEKHFLICGNHGQFDRNWENRIYCGEYQTARRDLGLLTVDEAREYLIDREVKENRCGCAETENDIRTQCEELRHTDGAVYP
ncbi:MAG: hypothetical protein HQL23_00840, partial [Candidatus Omnitrophica bacterium]|nr:hypothetical protein [Candidatus Omnitrophota bacterium]